MVKRTVLTSCDRITAETLCLGGMTKPAKKGNAISNELYRRPQVSPFDRCSWNVLNILHNLGHAVHCFNLEGTVLYWNAAAEELYGYRAEEALGKDVIELLCLKPDAQIAEKIIARQAHGDTWSGCFPLRKRNGDVFQGFCTNTPLRDMEDNIVGVIAVVCNAQALLDGPSAPSAFSQPGGLEEERTSRSQATKTPNCNVLEKESESQHSWLKSITDSALFLMENLPQPWASASREKLTSLIIPRKLTTIWDWGRVGFFSSSVMEKSESNASAFSISSAESDECRIASSQCCCCGEASSVVLKRCHSSHGGHQCSPPVSSSDTESSPKIVNQGIETVAHSVNNMPMSCGISLEDVHLKESIGEGSYATVYHAIWNGSHVAVKMFTEQDVTAVLLESFKKEVSIMKSARHPKVLLYMGIIAADYQLGIVTEFMPRGSLYRVLHKTRQPIDFTRRLHMAVDITMGMSYLHKCTPAIIHRDLKSSNLLVDKDWNVKIGDFGLSKFKHSLQASTRSMRGTPQWMAPEVLNGETADEKADVYSFGVVLWELCTRKRPWAGLSAVEVVGAVGYQGRELEIPHDLAPAVASILQRCLSRDPHVRPNFVELTEELRTVLKNDKSGRNSL